MVGGIAHNLKTPIFSISGGLEGLSDLINEYDAWREIKDWEGVAVSKEFDNWGRRFNPPAKPKELVLKGAKALSKMCNLKTFSRISSHFASNPATLIANTVTNAQQSERNAPLRSNFSMIFLISTNKITLPFIFFQGNYWQKCYCLINILFFHNQPLSAQPKSFHIL